METETIIIGGGQAGLALSYFLKTGGHSHIILEQASQAANSWRHGRWDSFTLVTPNWTFNLPGAKYTGNSPDGFLTREEIIKAFDKYIQTYELPIKYNQLVISVNSDPAAGSYSVITTGSKYECKNIVVASGLFQKPRIPLFSAKAPSHIKQLHSGEYRNPDLLPFGSVLIVGSGQSGCQIAEELLHSGRKVFLSTGSAGRVPRNYRGKDVFRWFEDMGFVEQTADQLPDPSKKFEAHPHLSGAHGGHSLNLHKFAKQGVVLLGRITDIDDPIVKFAPDLQQNLQKSDAFESEIIKMIDNFIEQEKITAPLETIPQFKDGYNLPVITELDLNSAGISAIIWASGYSFNFDYIKMPVLDNYGYPVQNRGVTKFPGLYFLGLPWLYKQKSGLLLGVGEDAEYISQKIINVKTSV